jgi:hypothetical protein
MVHGTGSARRNASALAFFPGGCAAFLKNARLCYLARLDPAGAPSAFAGAVGHHEGRQEGAATAKENIHG